MNRIVRKMAVISILGMMVLSVFTGFAGANGDDRDNVFENTREDTSDLNITTLVSFKNPKMESVIADLVYNQKKRFFVRTAFFYHYA